MESIESNVDTTQDSDSHVQLSPTAPTRPIFTNHYRSLSLSCLTSPLDALALACAAEQSRTVDANHGLYNLPEPGAENLQKIRLHSSDDCIGTFQGGMVPMTPSMIEASKYVTPDLQDSCSNHKSRSHSTDSLTIEISHDTTFPPQPSLATTANYVSQDFLQEIPSYISVNDVLCGRGGLTNHHPGNIFFRNLVRTRQEEYLRASKRDKANVAKDIVDIIRNQEPPGRFLKKVSEKSNAWAEIGDRKAREKTSQALREGAPELRGELSLKPGDTNFPIISPSDDIIAQSPLFGSSSKDSLEQFKDNLSDSSHLSNSAITNPLDTNMDAMSTSSHSSLPRPRVVSSDSFRSAASVFSSLDGIMDDSGTWALEDALIKRQKVRHRSFTDSGENNSIRNLCLPPPIRARMNSSPSEVDMIRDSYNVVKGPRLKLLKARFQRHEAA